MFRFVCKNLVQNGRITSRDIIISSNRKSVNNFGLNHVMLLLKSNGYCSTAISSTSSSSICPSNNNNNNNKNTGGEIKMTKEANDDDCRQVETTVKNGGRIVLDIVSYNKLIDLKFRQGKADEALSLLWDIPRNGLKVDQYTIGIVVNGLCKVGRVHEAVVLLIEAKRSGLPINTVPYNCILDACCKNGRFDRAIEIFEEMEVKKDSCTYTTLAHALCKVQKFSLASSIILRSLKDGMKVLPSVQQAVLKGLRASGLEREEDELKLAIQEASKE